jgi:hypothetical protein
MQKSLDNIQHIDWKSNKKRGENSLAEYFIERFNKAYNLNYRVIPNGEEASDADIHAISENSEALNLQLKTGEPGLEHFWGTRIKQGSGMAVIDTNIEELLNQIIKSGERHYANSKDLILLITERYQPTFDDGYALYISSKLKNTTFKGVYIVKLVAFDAKYPYEGQIMAIKDIFGNHGKIF